MAVLSSAEPELSAELESAEEPRGGEGEGGGGEGLGGGGEGEGGGCEGLGGSEGEGDGCEFFLKVEIEILPHAW